MYAPYSDEAVKILTETLLRERAAGPWRVEEPKRKRTRQETQNVRWIEAELDQARAHATGHVYA